MPSPIEQLFGNHSWTAWRNAHALRKALWFLLFAFIAMRLGTFIPLPGVDSSAWAESFSHLRGIFF
ncbi:MAG: preprotein translocase subunit SecY [Hyphomicrobiaceae bacterium]|jgi:preprotein translocase subunit SecY